MPTIEELEKEKQDLINENAQRRLKNKELEGQLADMKASFAKLEQEKGDLSKTITKLTEDSNKLKADSDAKISEISKAAQERAKLAEISVLAFKEGLVDRDGLKLADLSKVDFDDKGQLTGADEAIKALKEAKPYLFGNGASNTSNPANPPKPGDPKPKTAMEMTAEEYKAERAKLIKSR